MHQPTRKSGYHKDWNMHTVAYFASYKHVFKHLGHWERLIHDLGNKYTCNCAEKCHDQKRHCTWSAEPWKQGVSGGRLRTPSVSLTTTAHCLPVVHILWLTSWNSAQHYHPCMSNVKRSCDRSAEASRKKIKNAKMWDRYSRNPSALL